MFAKNLMDWVVDMFLVRRSRAMIVWNNVFDCDGKGVSFCGKRGCVVCHQKKLRDALKMAREQIEVEKSSKR